MKIGKLLQFSFYTFLIVVGLILWAAPQTYSLSNQVYVIQLVDDSINPVTAEYIIDTIDRAEEEKAQCLVIQLDTPGGLLNSTRSIVKRMLTAKVPIVVYISPSGSRAGSAGVFITYASHIAAMAPSTNIGAAHPVQLGDRGPKPKGEWEELRKILEEFKSTKEEAQSENNEEESDTEETAEEVEEEISEAAEEDIAADDDPMSSKILNDTVAFIKAIAKQRGRNVEWGVQSVTKSSSITVDEALEKGVVEIVAADLKDLLEQINGRSITINGTEKVLDTKDVLIERIDMDPRQKFFNVLADPNIAYFLMILGFYGLLFEITHPGFGAPGILGAIFLILAFYSMQTLPTNYAGLALLVLGLILLIAEAYTPAFGLFTLGGLVCMVLGSLLLFETVDPVMRVSKIFIFTFAGATAGFSIFVLSFLLKSRRKPALGGMKALIGQQAEVQVGIQKDKEGKVFIRGEIWNAVADEDIEKGEKVTVEAIDNMILKVKRLNK